MNDIKKYIKVFEYSIFAFFLLTLIGCADKELDNYLENGETLSVTFNISTEEAVNAFATGDSSTRAVDESMEGSMSNLYIVAVKIEDYNISTNTFTTREKPAVLSTSLNPIGLDFTLGAAYKNSFKIELYPGKYRFYAFANFDLYLSRFGHISDFLTEEEIKSITLNYKADIPLTPGHLPMACLPNEIKESENGNVVGENLVEITGAGKNLYVDMKFQCSKVRYTILYNNTKGGCSEAFGDQSIRFNVDYNQFTVASNLRQKTYLYIPDNYSQEDIDKAIMTTSDHYQAYLNGEATDYDQAYWSIDLNRYKFKDEFNENYPVKPSDDSIEPWTGSSDDWMVSNQRVWQGVCYLPENNTSGIDHTMLAFPYVYDKTVNGRVVVGNWDDSKFKMIWLFGDNTNEQHYPGMPSSNGSGGYYPDASKDNNYSNSQETENNHGLVRGMMYDVVAKVVNPEDLEMDIQVYVNVLSWTHHTSEAEDW